MCAHVCPRPAVSPLLARVASGHAIADSSSILSAYSPRRAECLLNPSNGEKLTPCANLASYPINRARLLIVLCERSTRCPPILPYIRTSAKGVFLPTPNARVCSFTESQGFLLSGARISPGDVQKPEASAVESCARNRLFRTARNERVRKVAWVTVGLMQRRYHSRLSKIIPG